MKKTIIAIAAVILFGISAMFAYGQLLRPNRPGGLFAPLNLSSMDVIVKTLVSNGTSILLGNVGIGTSTPNSSLQVFGTVSFTSSSTITTSAIGGSSLLAGDCASVTSTIDSSVSSSTASFLTTPQNDPGKGNWSYSFLSGTGVITTRVCASIAETPSSTPYNVKIIK